MNLALGFLIIFIIAIPGIVFRITYLSSPYSKRNINTTAIDEIFNSLIPAFVFHAISILLLNHAGYAVDFQFLFDLLIGNNRAQYINRLNSYLGPFLLYILVNTAVNFGVALILRKIVLSFHLYKQMPSLGIYNKWYYKLKPTSAGEEKISVWLDVLVETRNDTIIYRGFLTDFWLDREGGIKELHMEDVRRRVLSRDQQMYDDPENRNQNHTPPTSEIIEERPEQYPDVFEPDSAALIDERYYYIPGEVFIIKYEDVKNMNITYYEEQLNYRP